MRHHLTKNFALASLLAALPFAACECDELGNISSAGKLEPAVHNFGLVVTGEQCEVELNLVNDGQADLSVSESKFKDKNGEFAIKGIVPAFVPAFGEMPVAITYTAGSPGGAEGATFWLKTNSPKDDGVVSAVLRGTPVASAAGVLKTTCTDTDTTPCNELNFGATVVGVTNPGVLRTVRIFNDGTSTMQVLMPVVTENPDFTYDGALIPAAAGMGGTIPVEDTDWPIELEPGRAQCGVASENTRTWVDISVRYIPLSIGGDAGKLEVHTDAAVEPSSVTLGLVGIGSGDGIATNPEIIQFGEVDVGSSAEEVVRVFNLRTTDAAVNNSCIDIDRDDTCDVDCTAVDTSQVLSCGVKKSDGSHEGKGFVLSPADAQVGGNDERNLTVHWEPQQAGPVRAQLLLQTSLAGDRVWKVLINGGSSGTLTPSVNPLHVVATGTAPHIAGNADFTITNTGAAPLSIVKVSFDADAALSITGEFTLTRDGDTAFSVTGGLPYDGLITLEINESETFHMDYTNGASLNCDEFDIHIVHDGDGQVPYLLGVEVDGDACAP